MKESIKQNGSFTKDIMFWLRSNGQEGVQCYIDKLDIFMNQYFDNGKFVFQQADRDTMIQFVATTAEMSTIIKNTQAAPALSPFSVQQIEVITHYLNTSQDAMNEILNNPFTASIVRSLKDYPFESSSDTEMDNKVICDFIHLAQYFNVCTERVEQFLSKQQRKIKEYQNETGPLYREIDQLKQVVKKLESRLVDSSSVTGAK
jgi:hypothetical protein